MGLSSLNGLSGLSGMFGGSAGGGVAAGLLDGLVSFWKLDDASTADSYGSNTLTAVDGPSAAAGPSSVITRATVFNNSAGFGFGNYFKVNSNAGMQAGISTSLTMCCWVSLETKTNYRYLMGKAANVNAFAQMEYLCMYDTAQDVFRFYTSNGVDWSGIKLVYGTNFGSPSINTWYFICCWYDADNQQNGISINDGTPNLAANTSGPFAGTNRFTIAYDGGEGNFYAHDGSMASCGLWIGRVLTSAERTYLYNSGQGRTWPLTA